MNTTNHHPSTFNPATWLTISRFFLVPIFIYFFLIENFFLAVIILILASITDVTDGLLARKFNMGTRLGSVLDPLADKFLMMISFIVLSADSLHTIPWWVALIVIGRDFYIIFGLMYLYYVKRLDVKIKPSLLSKRTTFSQFLLLVFSFVKVYLVKEDPDIDAFYKNVIFNVQFALIYITAALTITTFGQYTHRGIQMLKEGRKRYNNTRNSEVL